MTMPTPVVENEPDIPEFNQQAPVWDCINLDTYPIMERESLEYKTLIADCRAGMEKSGYCLLENFVTASALNLLVEEAKSLSPLAFHNTLTGNAYLTPIAQNPQDDSDPELILEIPADDVRRMQSTTALGAVAYDQIPETMILRKIFEWDGLKDFLCDALGYEELHRYADPLGALNLAVMKEGDHLRWHFDQTDFVVSLLIQDCIAGGEYEVYPWTRSPSHENYERVRQVLSGSREGILTLDIKPGCLVLFKGRDSIHRVTPVEGDRERLIALFGYDSKPGVMSSDHLRMIRYGRKG